MVTSEGTRTVERTEVIASEPTQSLAAALDIEMPHAAGDPVPPLWHWTYLLERGPEHELGEDGHPVTGIPAPPGPGRRRMFGGGRVTTLRRLLIGEPATKVTSIKRSVDKAGRTGPLTLTTVLQEIFQGGELAIREEQDIVYRAPGSRALPPPPAATTAPAGPTLDLAVDERLLFRFSALTYNAHRIHYDLDWCRREGYDGLVIHGPLLALMTGEHLRRQGIDLRGKTFGYRFVSPLTKPQTITVVPGADGLQHGAEARGADGTVAAVSTLTEV
ncbi:MAG: mesaconyl-C4 CoA hydratase [Streptomyces sp.]|uniref:mesaconyl-C4 CoA hydratase n=1 Tax=Streptomyces sp. TaxID=1931 RepID=UPI0026009E81|nr:mesaconyl-C4 CoA hydratase [Streptomyces sp.]MBW8799006.1 mesaconyl-C4 CoA hydratase [Streptomyces sp.]